MKHVTLSAGLEQFNMSHERAMTVHLPKAEEQFCAECTCQRQQPWSATAKRIGQHGRRKSQKADHAGGAWSPCKAKCLQPWSARPTRSMTRAIGEKWMSELTYSMLDLPGPGMACSESNSQPAWSISDVTQDK